MSGYNWKEHTLEDEPFNLDELIEKESKKEQNKEQIFRNIMKTTKGKANPRILGEKLGISIVFKK